MATSEGGLPLARARGGETGGSELETKIRAACQRLGGVCGTNGKTIGLVVASVSFGLSLSILVGMCAFFANYWPLLSLIVYALLPLTYAVLALFPWLQAVGTTYANIIDAFGTCLAGTALSTLIALPFVFWRNGLITTSGEIAVWGLANAISLVGTSVAIIMFQLSAARSRRGAL
jgi:hypothetical protein